MSDEQKKEIVENVANKSDLVESVAEEVVEKVVKEVVKEQTTPYEFAEIDNVVFDEFSGRLAIVGRLALLTAFIGVIRGAVFIHSGIWVNGIASLLIMGILCFYIGYHHLRAAKAFRNIVVTEGDDISFTMKALKSLSRYYRALHGISMLGIAAAIGYVVWVVLKNI